VQATVQYPWPVSPGTGKHENGLLHVCAVGSQVSKKVAGRFLSRHSSSPQVASNIASPSKVALDQEPSVILVIYSSLLVARRCPTTIAFSGLVPGVTEDQVRCNAGQPRVGRDRP
jgi:hypothetical protein